MAIRGMRKCRLDHGEIRRRRDEGMSLKKIAAEVGCSKALVGLVVKDMPLKCLRCRAPIPKGTTRSKCVDCRAENRELHVRRAAQRFKDRYKPHPRKVSKLPQQIKAALLERPDLTMPEIAGKLGCSRIYVAKVAKREGIRRRLTAS